jgi:hypothetical protein
MIAVFSGIGFFLFQTLDEFSSFSKVLELLFSTTQGNFDFEIFDPLNNYGL